MDDLGITEALVNFCAGVSAQTVPVETLDTAKRLLLDYCGVAARGAHEPSGEIGASAVARLGSDQAGDCTVIGNTVRASPDCAALANGTSAHGLEMDDIHPAAAVHPGAPVLSAALAAGEWTGATGLDVLLAAVAGYEVACRLARGLDPGHAAPRYHSTGICGVFGAAAAAAKIMGLTKEQLTHAFGIAGSQAAGSREYMSNGAWTKRLHAGWAAHSGIFAATLAQGGFMGPNRIFEGDRGFYRSYAESFDREIVTRGLGDGYQMDEVAIKPFAACRHSQGAIEGTLNLVESHDLSPDSVERVIVRLFKAGCEVVADPAEEKRRPKTVVDAQFSIYFALASVVKWRKLQLEEYRQDCLESSELQRLMDRVDCVPASELDAKFPALWPAEVEVRLADGQRLKKTVETLHGDPARPLSVHEVIRKFEALTKPWMPADRSEEAVRTISTLEKLPIRDLMSLLGGP